MADLKISQFTDGGAVQPSDEIATNRAGVNTKVFVGSAAAADIGLGIGDVVTLYDDGGGNPQYPAGDGSLLTNIVSSDIEVVDAAGDTTMYLLLVGSATGTLQAMTDGGALYNATTNTISANIATGNAGLTIGASTPFSDSAGTLTLQNVDALDATTESTIEAAIDTLANLTSIQGQTISISAPFTVPADPNADRLFGWDDSAGGTVWFTLGTNLSITGTTINASGGGSLPDKQYAEYTSYTGLTTILPLDDTIPTSSEGTEVLSVSITVAASKRVRISFTGFGACASSSYALVAALYRGTTCINGVAASQNTLQRGIPLSMESVETPGAGTFTYSVRVGPSASGTAYLNGDFTSRLFGGAARATLIAEILDN